MKDMLLPQWAVDMTLALYRFTCAGFGKKVPKPYYGNFCVPFWAVLFTYLVPILTPFVMLAIVMRLLFGNRLGEAIGSTVVSAASQMVATKTRALLSVVLMAGLLAIPIVLFWAVARVALAMLGGSTLALAVILAPQMLIETVKPNFVGDFLDNALGFWQGLPRIVRWPLAGIFLTAFSPFILVFGIAIGLAIGIVFLYKNYCPLVRESSSA